MGRIAASFPQRRFDAIIPFTFWPSLVACLFRKNFDAGKVFWNHRGGYDDAGILYNKFLTARVLAHRPQFMANSNAGAQFLRDKFNLTSDGVTIIPNAYRPETEGSKTEKTWETKASQELSLVHVANFYPEKDCDTLLRALQLLNRRKVACRLHFCGRFLQASDEAIFFDRVRELNLRASIVYHGAATRQEVLRLLLEADIGLLSSKSEGQPNSLMEYMYAGLPVVATRIPGIQEVVGDANEKWLFRIGDAERLAELLACLNENPDLRVELGRRNRERIIKCFGPEQVLPKWADLLERN